MLGPCIAISTSTESQSFGGACLKRVHTIGLFVMVVILGEFAVLARGEAG